jgi:methionyl-tRNA formyltransferase
VQSVAPRRINDAAVVAELAGFGARALISMQYEQILRANLFADIRCPCLNLHFALLPRHRGVAPISWALIEGDALAGVTLHHMVVGIDAGDVIAQRSVPIGAETTARELYFAISDAAVALFRESYPFPDELLARSLAQDDAKACYHKQGDLDFEQREIAWKRPADELHRWIRSLIFPPLQLPETRLAGRIVQVGRIVGPTTPASGAAPGQVVALEAGVARVAAGGGCIGIADLRFGDDGEDAMSGLTLDSQLGQEV